MARTQRYTAKQVIQAIEKTGGIKDKIARNLGCHRDTVDNYIKRYPTVAAAYNAEKEKVLDLAEAQLMGKLDDGFWPAIRYYLSTQGKERGYVQKQAHEHTGAAGGPIEVEMKPDEIRAKLESKLRQATAVQGEEEIPVEPQ